MSRGPQEILEEWLVIEAQSGRSDALQALAHRWYPRLVGHAYRRTKQPEAAAEVVQEAWIAIIRGLRGLEDRHASASGPTGSSTARRSIGFGNAAVGVSW